MALFSAASRMNEAAPAGIAACGSDSSGGNKGIFIQRLDGERSEMGLSLPSICSLSSCHSTGVEEAPQSQKTDSEEVMIPGYHCSDRSSSTENCDSTHKKVSSTAVSLRHRHWWAMQWSRSLTSTVY